MRTTLTLDDDVASRIQELARRSRSSFKHVVNMLLRRGLSAPERKGPRRAYRVHTFRSELQPGVDLLRLSRLSDDLDDRRFTGA